MTKYEKQQKTLSPFELEAKKLVDKYADYKKIKKKIFTTKFRICLKLLLRRS
ncbi:hypothetical protein RNM28_01685 [Mesomycoplasma ovipneumoniae]|nr:hypothetical protein [Mesomycoplasma ovipneumoniae]WNM17630.1 hypothetical protein RNM28_01685 [Mesomycoplasma ovipneumoniae]